MSVYVCVHVWFSVYVCIYVYVCVYVSGVTSLPSFKSQELNLGHQAWQQAHLPAKPSQPMSLYLNGVPLCLPLPPVTVMADWLGEFRVYEGS